MKKTYFIFKIHEHDEYISTRINPYVEEPFEKKYLHYYINYRRNYKGKVEYSSPYDLLHL